MKNNKEQRIKDLETHADVANREMGEVKTDVKWLREVMQKLDDRTWWILAALIVGTLIQIMLSLRK